jgi:hypothetical protein
MPYGTIVVGVTTRFVRYRTLRALETMCGHDAGYGWRTDVIEPGRDARARHKSRVGREIAESVINGRKSGAEIPALPGISMASYGYARVSSLDQNLVIQRAALKAAGCDVIRAEKASGTRRDGRTELQVLLDFLRPGQNERNDLLVRIKPTFGERRRHKPGIGSPKLLFRAGAGTTWSPAAPTRQHTDIVNDCGIPNVALTAYAYQEVLPLLLADMRAQTAAGVEEARKQEFRREEAVFVALLRLTHRLEAGVGQRADDLAAVGASLPLASIAARRRRHRHLEIDVLGEAFDEALRLRQRGAAAAGRYRSTMVKAGEHARSRAWRANPSRPSWAR